MNVDAVLKKLHGVRPKGNGWMALCPAHADNNPSLSVKEDNGRILLHCFAGCAPHDVLSRIGMKLSDLGGESAIVSTYDYHDEQGNLLYQVVRYTPKDFRQRRPGLNGEWIANLNGTRRVLYCLRGVLAADELLVVEGEKDVETAWTRLEFPATCNSGGAGKWLDECSECLRNKRVVVIPDSDESGRKHALKVATSLHLRASSIKVVELPGAKDLSEWVDRGGTRDEDAPAFLASAQSLFADQADQVPIGNLNRRLEHENTSQFRSFHHQLSADAIDVWIQQVPKHIVRRHNGAASGAAEREHVEGSASVCVRAVRKLVADILFKFFPARF